MNEGLRHARWTRATMPPRQAAKAARMAMGMDATSAEKSQVADRVSHIATEMQETDFEKEEAQGEADQQVIAVLEAAATTAAQLEATERSLAQARGRPNPNPTPLTLTLTLGLTLT